MKPLVSIIVVNWNGAGYLENCFRSLYSGGYRNFEIILVDNGSTDNSVKLVRGKFDSVKVIEMGENLGLAIASNRGAEVAKGKYVFFLNNDTVCERTILKKLVRVAESDESIGICGCRTLTYDGKHELNAGVACDVFGYPYGDGSPLYVDAGIFIRRSVFEEIGGFDPKLFLYGEDKDLCWRTLLYGYKMKVVEDAVFRHDSFCGIDKQGNLWSNVRKRFMGEAFCMRMIIKNYSIRSLTVILPLFVSINLFEVLLFLCSGRIDVIGGTYFKAYLWNLRNLPDTLRLRRRIQAERRVSDWNILRRMYFGSGKLKLLRDVGMPRIS